MCDNITVTGIWRDRNDDGHGKSKVRSGEEVDGERWGRIEKEKSKFSGKCREKMNFFCKCHMSIIQWNRCTTSRFKRGASVAPSFSPKGHTTQLNLTIKEQS